jgi:hypothetical protein
MPALELRSPSLHQPAGSQHGQLRNCRVSLSSESWSSYRARLDLLGQAADSAEVAADRARMMASPPVTRLLADVAGWPGPDVLSRLPEAVGDGRFRSMAEAVTSKAGPDGLFVPESVYLAWKDWDFGQKKAPSSWLTLVATRILMRAGIA